MIKKLKRYLQEKEDAKCHKDIYRYGIAYKIKTWYGWKRLDPMKVIVHRTNIGEKK